MIMILMMMMSRFLVRECVASWRPVSTAKHLTAVLSTAEIATLSWTFWKMTSLKRALISSSLIHPVLSKPALIANTNTQV